MFPFFGAAAAPYKYYEDNFICAYDFSPGSDGASHRALLGILSMEGLLASMATMYFNISIVYEMRKKNSISHNDSTNTDSSTGRSLTETKIAFANVTVVVSAVFCICYVPFLARLLYDVIVTNVKTQDDFYHSITMSLLFLAPLLNPVVYVICNKRYRSFIAYSLRRRISNLCSKRSNKIDLIDHNSSLGPTSKKITASSVL
ncbi:uncharacterized protein LOC134684045 [Mytilus trossulus]|uniref:uncharacterized protein LOC134684045 n=1 Tax=Mytilus trossulus TaxID=6551 RepID=UPI003007CF7D